MKLKGSMKDFHRLPHVMEQIVHHTTVRVIYCMIVDLSICLVFPCRGQQGVLRKGCLLLKHTKLPYGLVGVSEKHLNSPVQWNFLQRWKCYAVIIVVQSLGHVQLFVTSWTVVHQAPLSSTVSQPPSFFPCWQYCFSLFSQFNPSVVSDSLRPHEPQHSRPPCPSPTL